MGENSSFGEWLRGRRKKWGLTQAELAEQTNVSPETIRKIEAGTRNAGSDVAEGLARHLGVPEDDVERVVRFAKTGYLDREIGDVRAHISSPGPIEHARNRPTNRLPSFPTTFVGREKEVEQVRRLVLRDDVRLVTLTGPAGIGKTRLATQVSSSLMAEFEEWVFFVALSPLTDPTMVVPAIAKALDVKEVSGQPLLDTLVSYLRDKRVLLFLDNFEQVVHAGKDLGVLLIECGELKMLVTSRETLRVYGEHEFPVPALTLPEAEAKELPDLEALANFEAVNLFTQRTRAVVSDFQLTVDNAGTIVKICRRLDALPLAIELAAARSRLLTPEKLLARLDHSLEVLTAGMQDLPLRQRTLRAAIAWSYDLLDEDEKALYRQISVFVGPASLESIERISDLETSQQGEARSGQSVDLLSLVESLLNKSLIRQDERFGEPKYGMLWTIREFGQERLAESGEAQAMSRRHAAYFLELAEEAEPHLTSAGRGPWLEQLEAEHHNLRAALDWCLSEEGDKEIGLRLAGALHWYWYFRGYLTEGRERLEKALTLAGAEYRRTALGAKALYAGGKLAYQQNDYAVMLPWLEESVSIWREVGDERNLAHALMILGSATTFLLRNAGHHGLDMLEEAISLFRQLGDRWGLAFALEHLGDGVWFVKSSEKEAIRLKEESLAVYRELGDQWGIAYELRELGGAAMWRGDYAVALPRLEEALEVGRGIGDRWELATVLRALGDVASFQDNLAEAESLYNASMAIYRELGDRLYISTTLRAIGHVARHLGEHQRAHTAYEQSLDLVCKLGNKPNIALTLAGLAGVAEAHGYPERAATLLGAAETIREASGGGGWGRVVPPADRIAYERNLAILREQLDSRALSEAWARGKIMTLDEAIAYACEAPLIELNK
jgi:predicted ATPase/transcriptional regulator with XRE-family HTH domain